MTPKNLKYISLSTPVYHPFWGKGEPIIVSSDFIKVKFQHCIKQFNLSYLVGEDCIDHLYLNPIKIVDDIEDK